MSTDQICLNADCQTIDPATIGHHVLGTDPPYSEHTHSAAVSKAAGDTMRKRDFGFASLTPELAAYLSSAAGAAARWSMVYCDLESAGMWAAKMPRMVRTVVCVDEPPISIPWIRWVMGAPGGGRPASCAEAIVLGHSKSKMRWGGPDNLQALCHKSERHRDKHMTEKPLDQALDLVAWFSDPGDLWYDPCAGRFTFGVACALLGRDYVGCEIDPVEATKGEARVTRARAGDLDRRDAERFRRWAASIGRASAGVLDLYGARFVKGVPV